MIDLDKAYREAGDYEGCACTLIRDLIAECEASRRELAALKPAPAVPAPSPDALRPPQSNDPRAGDLRAEVWPLMRRLVEDPVYKLTPTQRKFIGDGNKPNGQSLCPIPAHRAPLTDWRRHIENLPHCEMPSLAKQRTCLDVKHIPGVTLCRSCRLREMADVLIKAAGDVEGLRERLIALQRAWPTDPIYADATPDEGYPLRILRAHLDRAGSSRASGRSDDGSAEALAAVLNGADEERATILRRAVAALAARQALEAAARKEGT